MPRLLFAAPLLALLALGVARPAAAQCYPPPGLAPQQWLQMCGPTMQQGYQMGVGGGMSYEQFLGAMYQRYQQSAAPAYGGGGGQRPMNNQCNVGLQQCFNGWLRSCVPGPLGSTWQTSAQHC